MSSMLTYRLWRALQNPPLDDPLFDRMSNPPRHQRQGATLHELAPALAPTARWVMGIAALIIAPAIIIVGSPILMMLIFLLPLLLALTFVFSGTLYGTVWTIIVSGALARERREGTYELLCLSPSGALGACWRIAAGCLHRSDAFQRVAKYVRRSVLLISIPAFLIAINNIAPELAPPIRWLLVLVNMGAIITAFAVDLAQSVVVSNLVGMLVPTYIQRRIDTQVWSAGIFLALQLLTYLLMWQIGFRAVNVLFDGLALNGWLADLTLPLLRLWLFYAARERLIRYLWDILLERLGAVPHEAHDITGTLAV